MFDLEVSIALWRQKVQRAGIRSVTTLDELESHLRDDLEAQLSAGVDPAQAFELAAWRIGPPADLRSEFNLADETARTRKTACWYFATTVIFQVLAFRSDLLDNLSFTCVATLLVTSLVSYLGWKVMRQVFYSVASQALKIAVCAGAGLIGVSYVLLVLHSAMSFNDMGRAQSIQLVWWMMAPLHVLNLFVLDQYQSRPKKQYV
jgi:hypothetical protein